MIFFEVAEGIKSVKIVLFTMDKQLFYVLATLLERVNLYKF